MRSAFSDALVRIARKNPEVLLLTGDHGYSLFDAFRRDIPKQYINAGIAEQNMVGIAAGLARSGFRPFVYGLSAFVPVRVVEQIKLDVAHDSLPVIFIGDGAGFVYSHLGTSHQSTEDLACTRAIPGLSILSPCDAYELTMAMDAAMTLNGPVYLRMGKADLGPVHEAVPTVPVGEPILVRRGRSRDLAFLATGSMVRPAIELANEKFPAVSVWSFPWIKPASEAAVVEIARTHTALVVLEEHSVNAGFGSLVAEITAGHAPLPVLRIGVADRFSEHCGSYEYLLREHGLDMSSIAQRIIAFVEALGALRS